MKVLIAVLAIASSTLSFAGTSMNLEGSCKGKLRDSTPVAFKYYSNFDGCKQTSTAAITFTNGNGLLTGKRYFQNGKDIYSFPNDVKVIFADSTGNVGGTLKMNNQSVKVTCSIRDYEYASEC